MKQAEAYMREKGFGVIGGYVSPCHPSYLYEKLGYQRQEAVPSSTRNKLIELALADDPCWTLDLYMASTDKFVSNDIILRTFKERVDAQIGTDIHIGWVMGTDNFSPYCAVPGMHQIVVENRDPESA